MMQLINLADKNLTEEEKANFIEKLAINNVDIDALRIIHAW